MRLYGILAIGVLVVGPSGVRAQARPPADSQRAGGMRVLQVLQGFQMASSPELASAINALLLDDGAHMRMAPKRALAAGDSARAGEIVKSASDLSLQQHRQRAGDVRRVRRDATGVVVVQEG
jgi:hypothetical protein